MAGPPSTASATQACAGQIPFRKMRAITRSAKTAIPPGLRPFNWPIDIACPLRAISPMAAAKAKLESSKPARGRHVAAPNKAVMKKGTVVRIHAASRTSRWPVE